MRYLTFICYAHQDRDFRDKFLTHLAPFKRNSVIRDWSDKEIRSGKPWKKEIQKALEQAQALRTQRVGSDFKRAEPRTNRDALFIGAPGVGNSHLRN
jgi:hypothetical protein